LTQLKKQPETSWLNEVSLPRSTSSQKKEKVMKRVKVFIPRRETEGTTRESRGITIKDWGRVTGSEFGVVTGWVDVGENGLFEDRR
jgi:hypothetical protein